LLGFPDVSKAEVPTAQWVVLLKQSTEAILVVFKALSQFEIIREAVSLEIHLKKWNLNFIIDAFFFLD